MIFPDSSINMEVPCKGYTVSDWLMTIAHMITVVMLTA